MNFTMMRACALSVFLGLAWAADENFLIQNEMFSASQQRAAMVGNIQDSVNGIQFDDLGTKLALDSLLRQVANPVDAQTNFDNQKPVWVNITIILNRVLSMLVEEADRSQAELNLLTSETATCNSQHSAVWNDTAQRETITNHITEHEECRIEEYNLEIIKLQEEEALRVLLGDIIKKKR